jgi:cob(I)alamin adenosyltransferase
VVKIYTKRGDDGTTGLLYGGRVRKDSAAIELNGAVDEAQAALGVARAEVEPGSDADELLLELERQLYVLMAEVATAPEQRSKLAAGTTLVTAEMVAALEGHIDEVMTRFEMPADFALPGQNRASAALDLARTVVRRAERLSLGAAVEGSLVGPYLNRLSDLVWAMARWLEGDVHVLARQGPRSRRAARGSTS